MGNEMVKMEKSKVEREKIAEQSSFINEGVSNLMYGGILDHVISDEKGGCGVEKSVDINILDYNGRESSQSALGLRDISVNRKKNKRSQKSVTGTVTDFCLKYSYIKNNRYINSSVNGVYVETAAVTRTVRGLFYEQLILLLGRSLSLILGRCVSMFSEINIKNNEIISILDLIKGRENEA